MKKGLFDYDPLTGMRITYEDTEDGGFLLHYSQDAEPVLDANARKRGLGRAYYAADPDMWRVASIPIGVQMEWLTKYGIDVYNPEHEKAVVKLLNDPDWRYLKTGEIII